MIWNTGLYQYHKQHGGTFLGTPEGTGPAELILQYRDAPLVVRHETVYRERFTTFIIRVMTTLPLERPYSLTISREKVVNQGLNLVNRADYGWPELSPKRRIQTNETAFTTAVLRDRTLRKSLETWTNLGLSVAPIAPDEGGPHLLSVTTPYWGVVSGDEDSTPESDEKDALRITGMVMLAQQSRDAVLNWRM